MCGYIYDPAVGDPSDGVAPGTAFEDLPDDWLCPDCGADNDQFEPLSEHPADAAHQEPRQCRE